MIDALLYRHLQPSLNKVAKPLVKLGMTANQMTMLGFAIGLCALPALAFARYDLALLHLTQPLSDGLDGAMARQTQRQTPVVILIAFVTLFFIWSFR